MNDQNLNSLEQDDIIAFIRELAKRVKELEAEVLRLRKLLQE